MRKDNLSGTDFQLLIDRAVGNDLDYEAFTKETLKTDLVIVGAGASGLPAAVEALQKGKRVIVLEHNGAVGGSAVMCFGILGVNSPLQKKLGVSLTKAQIIKEEQKIFDYRIDGAWLNQMLSASGENIAWLEELGVRFSGEVNTYMTDGQFRSYHPFGGSFGNGVAFVRPLKEKIEKLEGQILLRTAARKLIKNEAGKVIGLYAQRLDNEQFLRIDCHAVILACGGYENCDELLSARGYDPKHMVFRGAKGHDGSGIYMALDAGGANYLEKSSLNESPTNMNLKYHNGEYLDLWIGLKGRQVIVNGRGERFFDETASREVRGYGVVALRTQRDLGVYEIYDQDVLDAAIAHVKRSSPGRYDRAKVMIQESVEEGCPTVWRADSAEDLAEKTGIPKEQLVRTLTDYNRYCRQHEDEDFGKNPEDMWELHAPYYCMKYTDIQYIHSNGAIHTGRDSQVLTEKHEEIPGLYAVGTLGAEFWQGYYSMNIPGGCMAFNVDSGRRAVRHAIEHCFD